MTYFLQIGKFRQTEHKGLDPADIIYNGSEGRRDKTKNTSLDWGFSELVTECPSKGEKTDQHQ